MVACRRRGGVERRMAMQAADVMTRKVVTVPPAATAQDIARLLVRHRISAVPVVDKEGGVVGMVSEGDLAGHRDMKLDERSEWWLQVIAEGTELAPDFLSYIRSGGRQAKDLMTKEVVSVGPATPLDEVARLLQHHRIKRVPVIEDGKLVGIVSRANLLEALEHTEDHRFQTASAKVS